MSYDRSELLGSADAVDSQTAVPVASKVQQLSIRRYGKQM